MMFKTHIVFAFLVGLLAIDFLNPRNQILFITLVMFGGLLPDIDHPKSKIGRYFRPVMFLFEHRGFFHSFLMLPVLALVILVMFNWKNIAIPLIIGYASHLFSDLVTKEGIMPFHPLSKFRLRGMIKTGGKVESLLLVFLVLFSAYYLFTM